MAIVNVDSKKMIEPTMGMWNSLLQLNVLRRANHEEDEERYNDINEVVHSIFKVAIQTRQLKQEREGDNTTNENYEEYEEEILELVKEEVARLQKENPHILLNMPINLFERMVKEVLEDKDTMNIAIVQWANMLAKKETAQSVANGEIIGTSTTGATQTIGGAPMGGMPMGGMPGQFPPNMGNMYPQNQNQNQDATIVPQDTPEGQDAIDEIDKQTGGHFKKKLKSITKNGIHPQVALVATNTGALIAGMLIPGAGFLIMTAALKANLEILPKWPKKKLKPVVQNWFEEPNKDNPDKNKDNPDKNNNNPNNPQQGNQQQMPPFGGMPNGGMMGPNGGMMGPNGGMMGPNGGMMGPGGTTGPNGGMAQGGISTKKPLQIWETVASNLVHNNRIKTETKLTYYVDKDGKIYINSKENGIKSEKEYIELTTNNLEDYLTFIAQKNGLGETESMKEFIDQVSKITKGEIGIKEINNSFIDAIQASAKLSEMSEDGKLSEYGKEIYNELVLQKFENLVEFDPNKPIEEEIIKQLEETKRTLTEKLSPENLEKLNEEEKQQFTQMLNGVNNTLNMIEIYKGIELIKEKEQEIDLLKDKKKLDELYKQQKEKEEESKINKKEQNKIQEDKKELDKQIEKQKKLIEKSQKVIDLRNRREELERQFEKELESLYNSLEQSKNIFGDDEIDEKLVEEIENKIKERDEKLQEIDNTIQQVYQQNLEDLNNQKVALEKKEKENKEEAKTITKSKDEIDNEIKEYKNKVNKYETEIEKEKNEKIDKLEQEKNKVEKLQKEKEEIENKKKKVMNIYAKEKENLEQKNEQEADKTIIESYNKNTEEIKKLDKESNDRERQIEEYEKEKIELEKDNKKNHKNIEDLTTKMEKLRKDVNNFKQKKSELETQNKNMESRVELAKLREKERQNEQELNSNRSIEEINSDIEKVNEEYKQKKNKLEDINSIENKQKEVEELKEKTNQKVQTLMSQELITIQEQMLRNSQFAGLSKIVSVESVDMPQYQPPVISVEQGKEQDVEIER